MKNFILIINFALLACFGNAQQTKYLDSLHKAVANEKNDSEKLYTTSFITSLYTNSKPDSAIMYAQQEISLAKKMKSDKALSTALRDYAGILSATGNYPQAIYFELEALKLVEKSNDFFDIGWCYSWLANTYINAGDYEHGLFYLRKQKSLLELHHNFSAGTTKNAWQELYNDAIFGFAVIYDKLNLPNSALNYLHLYLPMANDINEIDNPESNLFGDIYFTKGDYARAISYYRQGYQSAINWHIYNDAMWSCNGLAKTFRKTNLIDSSILYAKKSLDINNYANYASNQLEAFDLLADIYKANGNSDSAVKYLQLSLSTKDSLFNQRKIMQMQTMTFNEQLRQQDIADAQKAYRDKIATYIFIGGLIALLLVALQLQRSAKEKQMAELQHQKTDLKMQALRAQMNPHFIFNSLNSINRFILQNNRAQASEYLTKFSRLVRMILQNSQASLITLESELESLKLYLELEALRFNYHFDYKISVPNDLDIEVLKVPPLIIQPYAENAIWHGLMHKEEKGNLDIDICEENNFLFFKITDDGIGRKKAAELNSKSATKHKSVGLKITADRITMMQNIHGNNSPVTINDLVNADGSTAGTEVIIKMLVIYD